jgi:Clp amino terminal domain, pathogenicity island component
VNDRDRFDKFTERARKVLSLAQEEAQRRQHNYIGTEHLLLGLVHLGEGGAITVLLSLGVDLSTMYERIQSIISHENTTVYGEIGLTPRAKKVIELAVDEARLLNHHYIGTEHLLLGLVREGEGIAAGVLESLGLNLEKVRTQTIQMLSQPELFYIKYYPKKYNIQRVFIQTIFNYFHQLGTWPSYGYVEREISQIHRDFDLREVTRGLPSGFANAFALNLDREQEAILKAPAILLCKGSEDDLADFVHVLQFCVDKYFGFGENNLYVASHEVRAKLNMSELSIRKVGQLIEAEGSFWSNFGRNDTA